MMTCSGHTTKNENTLSRPDDDNLTQRKISRYTVLLEWREGEGGGEADH